MRWSLFAIPVLLVACGDVEEPGEGGNDENEVITTVELSFAPSGGGAAQVFAWADPENDGSPQIDGIELDAGVDYTLSVAFLNELEDPAEDITEEVEAEGEDHQVFFVATGSLLTVAAADSDGAGLPLGIENDVSALAAGSGTLRVVLQHMPPVDGAAQKVEGLADEVATSGPGGLPGSTDVDVEFPLVVK